MSGCVDCGAPTPKRKCRECSLMDRTEEMARLAQDGLEEDIGEVDRGEAIESDGGRPMGHPCPECGDLMDVGAWGLPGESITWQQCDDCRIGWGPFTGYVDLDKDDVDRGEGVATDGGLVCDVSGCEDPAAVRVYPTKGRTNHAALRCWDCLDKDRDSGHFAEWRAAIERERDFDQIRLETDGGVATDRYEVSSASGIVYGPAFDSEGYVLLVATEERRVEIEFDEDAMYTLWTEVKGVPWPEPDHIGEKDRLVRQVLHAANGADEEMLREALRVLGGERP
ncbi:hypothetical protein [Halobellus ordinarius]|uniref:hypothetical protein n=1 Tax=Halobellus ordinarius TaxID=3075120 RepID=UPI0028805D9C|nr:hypothetical protein [Halobellus sp. ZY16]